MIGSILIVYSLVLDTHTGLCQIREWDCYKYMNVFGSALIIYSLLVEIRRGVLQIRESDWLNLHCLCADTQRSCAQ